MKEFGLILFVFSVGMQVGPGFFSSFKQGGITLNLLATGIGKCLNRAEYEYRNLLTTAKIVVNSALERKESRGAHSRADFNNIDSKAIHTEISKNRELLNVK